MNIQTPIYKISSDNNQIYIKREDLIPYSFGGNKARKCFRFFEEIDCLKCDYVVTYGSKSSNHCRVVANMAFERNMPCIVISPEESDEKTYNYELTKMFGADYILCPISEVHKTIEDVMEGLKSKGYSPYFIEGGGHGNIGTEAYVQCYREIVCYEKQSNMKFDYIFHASGTGTTQAGLICGQYMLYDKRKIVGISIARTKDRGRNVILQSVYQYLQDKIEINKKIVEDMTIFVDDYIAKGYGQASSETKKIIEWMMKNKGIPLDVTYTGKAYWGMLEYIKKNKISNKNILFIHTGGTPLFFDYLKNR